MSLKRPIKWPIKRPLTRAIGEAGGGGVVTIVNNGVLAPFVTFTRSSTATYFDSAGVMRVAAANQPRVDYNPATLALRGLLVEEQRTNLLLRSTLAGGGDPPTGWGKTIGTGTSAPAASIYGSADGAVAYSQAATAQRPFYEQAVATTVGVVYTLSLSIEAVSGLPYSSIIGVNGITPSTVRRNGVIVVPTDAAQPGRVESVFTAAAASSGIRIGIGVGGNATGTVTFSRPQLEAGAFSTSYIPTTGTAQTRAIDDPDFTIPAGIVRLQYTYDDNTTADVAVTPGAAYQIPTSQKRIKFLRGYRS